MRNVDNFIDGKSEAPVSGKYMDAINPATGEVVANVGLGGLDDVTRAVASAKAAQPDWAIRPAIERAGILNAIGRAIRNNADELVDLEVSETGKLRAGMAQQVLEAADYFEYYGGICRAFFGDTIDMGASQHVYTRHEPFGVIGMITPWNSPLTQGARGLAPAIAVGNAVVVKPSEFTSSTTSFLARIACEAGLPPGIFNSVIGTGTDVGAALVNHDDVSKIVFTGSVRTGRYIAEVAAKRLVPATLELGGKSPNIIFADADLDGATQSAITYTRNTGQVCSALTRLLVERPIYDEMVTRVVAAVSKVTPGDKMAPLTTRAQFEKVQEYFEVGANDGATLAFGGTVASEGELAKGQYVNPTVFSDVTPEMRIFQEEVFGPVLTVTPFDDEDEAVRLANGTEYGLIASIWTRDIARVHRMIAKVDAGQVLVNGGKSSNETPFGGFKSSGLGREKGFESLRDYTQTKTVIISIEDQQSNYSPRIDR